MYGLVVQREVTANFALDVYVSRCQLFEMGPVYMLQPQFEFWQDGVLPTASIQLACKVSLIVI